MSCCEVALVWWVLRSCDGKREEGPVYILLRPQRDAVEVRYAVTGSKVDLRLAKASHSPIVLLLWLGRLEEDGVDACVGLRAVEKDQESMSTNGKIMGEKVGHPAFQCLLVLLEYYYHLQLHYGP